METMQKKPAGQPYRPFYSPWLLWIVWIIWLPFLIPCIFQLLQSPVLLSPVLALAGIAVFVFVYCFFSFRVALEQSGSSGVDRGEAATILGRTGIVLVMLVLSIAIEILGRPRNLDPTSLFIYTVAYAGSAFRIPRGILTNTVVLAICLALGVLIGLSLPALAQSVFLIVVVSFMTMSWTQSIVTSRKLHEAQDEIARLAAADERLRIARDLHDLLGQKLSFIALKSELARHLVSSAPDRAEAEIAEVESTVRSTLQEVREAVAGYRKPDLARELRAAQEILSAAGIQFENRCRRRCVERLSPQSSEALAWVVREGVTNVIRHSRAKTCVIDLREDPDVTTVEILDDGTGDAEASAGILSRGSGLRGLRERFAALGGRCDAGNRAPGGFVLTASVPTGGRE